jgi:hypothetical protein
MDSSEYLLIFGWTDNTIITNGIEKARKKHANVVENLCGIGGIIAITKPELSVFALQVCYPFKTQEDAEVVFHAKMQEDEEVLMLMVKAAAFFFALSEVCENCGLDDMEALGAPEWHLLQASLSPA